jgi:mono/diheme cytochrome c family protein
VASHIADPEVIAPGLRPAPSAVDQHELAAMLAALARGRSGSPMPAVNDDGRMAVLFNRNCLRCHVLGSVGGKDGPALTDVRLEFDHPKLVRQITNPLEVKPDGEMPSFAGKLSEDEISALARWLLTR